MPVSVHSKVKEYVKKSDNTTMMKFVTDAVTEKLQREAKV